MGQVILSQSTILVVDDTPENLTVLHELLAGRYKVKLANSGARALKIACTDNPPDLILLDIMMPDMDGYMVCAQLKADPRLADIPVIFISALTNAEDKVQAFAAGGVDYVSKPFQAEEVDARVATHLALRHQRRQLRQDFEQLRALESLRDNLVHMIIHDMRTPLTAIQGFLQTLELLESEQMSADGREFVQRSLDAASELIEMVSSLLDVSKMEAGEMNLNLEPCEMMVLTRAAVTELASLREDREMLVRETTDTLPVQADRELVRRILRNLLSNALKYTPSLGRVQVGAEERGELIYVSVQDSGPGIPPEYHGKIFEKFGQVDTRAHQRKYSTGLGLTFCKLAVEAHGGQIGVESTEGQGSLFWFTLPKNGPGR